MPSSTVRTFADSDAYHAAIRARRVEGVVTARGNFKAAEGAPAASRRTIGSSAAKEPYNGLLDYLRQSGLRPASGKSCRLIRKPGPASLSFMSSGRRSSPRPILSAALAKSRRVGRRELAHGSTAIGLDKIAAAPG